MTIEKGIPVPPIERGHRRWRFLLEMKDGESVFVDSNQARSAALMFAKRSGLRIVSRKVDGGYRLWRVKEVAA
jgi:hypothetical protein